MNGETATMSNSDAALNAATDQIERAMAEKSLRPTIAGFFDEATNTVSYVVHDPASREAAIIDSVLDYEAAAGRTSHGSADRIVEYVTTNELNVTWVIETHAHADHISAAPYLQEKLGGKLAIGVEIVRVQEVFGKLFNAGTDFERDGSQFDHLFTDGETFSLGAIEGIVLHVPGHTPADMAFIIGDAAFVGDTIFMPDFGTARADFPGGDARELFQSIRRLLSLPEETRLFLCHDYERRESEIPESLHVCLSPNWVKECPNFRAQVTGPSKCNFGARIAFRLSRCKTTTCKTPSPPAGPQKTEGPQFSGDSARKPSASSTNPRDPR